MLEETAQRVERVYLRGMGEIFMFGFGPYYLILEAYLPLIWCFLKLTHIKDRSASPQHILWVGGQE